MAWVQGEGLREKMNWGIISGILETRPSPARPRAALTMALALHQLLPAKPMRSWPGIQRFWPALLKMVSPIRLSRTKKMVVIGKTAM